MSSVEVAEVLRPVENLTVVAADAGAMAVSQGRLGNWCQAKIRESRAAMSELEENLSIATKNKWRTKPLANAVRREKQRIVFYGKVFAALKAGYCIIPNLDGDVFAIRTSNSARGLANSDWGGRQGAIDQLPTQKAGALPIGEGEHQSPTPMGQVYDTDVERDANQKVVKTTNYAEVVGFSEIDFPFAFAKTEILSETQRAMALKIFDEMVGVPGNRRKGDPMVVGRIRKPWMKQWQSNRDVTFLIVWFVDTAAL